jgi:hypothetical protein
VTAKSVQELDAIAAKYISEHFPGLEGAKPTRGTRQAKMPGAPAQHVYDYAGGTQAFPQRVRLVLNSEGKVVKVATSH